jgi:hypothetical protein
VVARDDQEVWDERHKQAFNEDYRNAESDDLKKHWSLATPRPNKKVLPEGGVLISISPCNLCVLCVSVVIGMRDTTTTETQRTQRLHREEFKSGHYCS